MSCVDVWYNGSSHVVEITDLTNDNTGALVSSGVAVTAKIVEYGESVAVANGTTTLSAVSGSPGTWRGVFSRNASLTPGQDYEVVVTADGGEFLTRVWRFALPVEGPEASS